MKSREPRWRGYVLDESGFESRERKEFFSLLRDKAAVVWR